MLIVYFDSTLLLTFRFAPLFCTSLEIVGHLLVVLIGFIAT
jgi:hypothetical protein